jgi:hypothetical protein
MLLLGLEETPWMRMLLAGKYSFVNQVDYVLQIKKYWLVQHLIVGVSTIHLHVPLGAENCKC